MLKEKYFISIFLLVLAISCNEEHSKSITITDKTALDKLIDDQINKGLRPFLYLRLEDTPVSYTHLTLPTKG